MGTWHNPWWIVTKYIDSNNCTYGICISILCYFDSLTGLIKYFKKVLLTLIDRFRLHILGTFTTVRKYNVLLKIKTMFPASWLVKRLSLVGTP